MSEAIQTGRVAALSKTLALAMATRLPMPPCAAKRGLDAPIRTLDQAIQDVAASRLAWSRCLSHQGA